MLVRANIGAWFNRDNHFVKLVVASRMGIDANTPLWRLADGLT
jgi:hypothetical protein